MSQKILRIFTIIVIGVATFCILFGGTYIYEKYLYTDPLEKAVSKIDGVGVFQVEQGKDRLIINVQFNLQEKLRPNFYFLLEQLKGQKNRDLSNVLIKIENTPQDEIAGYLKTAKLPIYEAISTGHFTALSEQLTSLAAEKQINYDLEIDDQFIFVTAHQGDVAAHMVINRGTSPLEIITKMGEGYL